MYRNSDSEMPHVVGGHNLRPRLNAPTDPPGRRDLVCSNIGGSVRSRSVRSGRTGSCHSSQPPLSAELRRQQIELDIGEEVDQLETDVGKVKKRLNLVDIEIDDVKRQIEELEEQLKDTELLPEEKSNLKREHAELTKELKRNLKHRKQIELDLAEQVEHVERRKNALSRFGALERAKISEEMDQYLGSDEDDDKVQEKTEVQGQDEVNRQKIVLIEQHNQKKREEDLRLQQELSRLYEFHENHDVTKVPEKVEVVDTPAISGAQLNTLIAALGQLATGRNQQTDNAKFLARQSTSRELPSFNGKAEDWPIFYADFVRTTADCQFTNSENMTRLRRCLKDPAAEYVKSMFVSPENVPKIIQRLKQRFGQPEHIISDMMEKARRVKTVTSDNMESLIQFGAAVINFTATVVSLDRPEYLSNPQLLRELEGKMSDSLKMQWINWVKDLSTRVRNLEHFSIWISQQADVACEVSPPVFRENKPEPHIYSDHSPKKKVTFNSRAVGDNPDIPTAAGLFAGTSLTCVFCGGMHESTVCVKAQDMHFEDKREKVRLSRACFTCLKLGHVSQNCQVYVRCILCRRSHQSVMCPEIMSRGELPTQEDWRMNPEQKHNENPDVRKVRENHDVDKHRETHASSSARTTTNMQPSQDIRRQPPFNVKRSPNQNGRSFENHSGLRFDASTPSWSDRRERPTNTTMSQHTTGSQQSPNSTTAMSRQTVEGGVLLGTTLVNILAGGKSLVVRLVFDNGNMQSSIRTATAKKLRLPVIGEDWRRSNLYGGVVTEPRKYSRYSVCLQDFNGSVQRQLTLVDEPTICHPLPRVPCGAWTEEFAKKNVRFFDITSESEEIEILIGNDYYQELKTGRTVTLKCGLTAEETIFGWTLNGKVPLKVSRNDREYHEVPNSSDTRMIRTTSQEIMTESPSNAELLVSMFRTHGDLQDLWELDTLGIRDPAETKTKVDQELDAKKHFAETVTKDEEGRFSVSMPWSNGVQIIPSNFEIAEKRLASATNKLLKSGKFDDYGDLFTAWEKEGIIEVCDNNLVPKVCHYLPHRPVFKPNSLTTPVRPVFDASCKNGRNASLNDCLEKGPNLMELIPNILMRFREKKIGIVADIRKAFQMISVNEQDRDFLRFLWWEDQTRKKLRVYRHKRVVFGVNCSPFLLAAVLEHHLGQGNQDHAEKLLRALYVDNCLTSMNNLEECLIFQQWSVKRLAEAKMELREWEAGSVEESGIGLLVSRGCGLDFGRIGLPGQEKVITSVLGYKWDKVSDSISCEIPELEKIVKFTKRVLLSSIQKFFDPLGMLMPTLIHPKLLLQEAWKTKRGWDEELPLELKTSFEEWMGEVSVLKQFSIPRHMSQGMSHNRIQEYHVFCDASKKAYAAVVFLRTIEEGRITVKFVQSRARVAPLKETITIPRLELLSCAIGARLLNSIVKALEGEDNEFHDVSQSEVNDSHVVGDKDHENLDVSLEGSEFHEVDKILANHTSDAKEDSVYLWTDSTTALAWIQRNDELGTFVGNRVREICKLTKPENWRHVAGIHNPADLPSRGCTPGRLVESEWIDGPKWLKLDKENWPRPSHIEVDEEEIALEKKKAVQVKLLTKIQKVTEAPWYMPYSTYKKNWRFIAWMLRYKLNLRRAVQTKKDRDFHIHQDRENPEVIAESRGEMSSVAVDPRIPVIIENFTFGELEAAEKWLCKLVQSEVFCATDNIIAGISVMRDEMEVIRVKTRILNREDTEQFKVPILLPSHHPLVSQLIIHEHENNCHAGTQLLSGILREKFWILQARRTINSAIYRCIRCVRFKSQRPNTVPSQLPGDRVGSAKPFEIIGVDLAGPLFAKGEKVWIVLYTCAVYRCLNLELVSSLSTEAFLESFTRHCARRGRPTTVYSDNGTNFVGANNLFKSMDWKKIEETAHLKRIRWKFNPPSAAWWGGWWERFVRTVKDLLRKNLGKSSLSYEKLNTLLCEIEGVINRRPLTTVTDNADDLRPLTPAMFLNEAPCPGLNECMDASGFQKCFSERKTQLEAIKMRFRKEYISMLIQREKEKKIRKFMVGDIVLVASDNKRRWEWPLARIIELIPGKDGHVRMARVMTATTILDRPIPRLFPMEVSSAENRPLREEDPEQPLVEVDGVPVNEADEVPPDNVEDEAKGTKKNVCEDPEVITRSGRKVKSPTRLGIN